MISTLLQQCSGSDTVEMDNAGLMLAAGRRGCIRLAALRVNLPMGDRDTRNAALSDWDEKSLVKLSKALRKDFNAPNAKFVCASPGQTKQAATVAGGETLDAMQAVDGKSRKHADFKGNVSSIYTPPRSKAS